MIRHYHYCGSLVAVVVDEEPVSIKIFNIYTGKESHHLTLQTSDQVAQVRLFGKLLIAVSRQMDRYSGVFIKVYGHWTQLKNYFFQQVLRRRRWHLCVWKTDENNLNLVCEHPLCDSYQIHGSFNYKLLIDEKFIVLIPNFSYGETLDANVFIISTENFRHYRTISCGPIYVGAIHYQHGVLAYATEIDSVDVGIRWTCLEVASLIFTFLQSISVIDSFPNFRIIDVATANILNTLPTDDYPECLRLSFFIINILNIIRF